MRMCILPAEPPEPGCIVQQGTDEWWQARRGKITASSRLETVLYGGVKGKNSMIDKIIEELQDDFVWPPEVQHVRSLNWGRDHEDEARHLIEMMYDVETHQPGLMVHPEVQILAATPDYTVNLDSGTVGITGEIKCPIKPEIHQALFLQGVKSDRGYLVQVQGEMLVAQVACGWFSSYDPRAAAPIRLSREIILPDDEMQTKMLEGCEEIARMVQSDSRFAKGRTTTPSGVRKIF